MRKYTVTFIFKRKGYYNLVAILAKNKYLAVTYATMWLATDYKEALHDDEIIDVEVDEDYETLSVEVEEL